MAFFVGRIGIRTHINADVRWTSASRRLDGGCSVLIIESLMQAPSNRMVFFVEVLGLEAIILYRHKCYIISCAFWKAGMYACSYNAECYCWMSDDVGVYL